ncbi:uncharacterized protein OCT59_013122 [Rhizophagus irregularis]|uniref:uncharacterized protein n=1 Tax=Rhizophagus irregularis TaxID=588596 RepID=UPI003329982B|nr:hypothetical protein OCT59_013122 [Rhizophagus irregularis]
MSNLAEPINISSELEEEERSPLLSQELVNNEEKLENTLALISSVYHITDIRHSLFPIEYPDTSDDGIAYVFHVENWTDKKAVFNNIQYSLGKPGGAHSNIFCPFLGVQCKDDKKSCQGMKICKIATPEFKDDDKNCFTLIPSASQKQKCQSCPYIVMVVKNTHSHPPPPPHRTPNHLQQDLKSLIENSNDLLIDSTSRRLISGPLIKAVFGETVLADVHASMNNIDKLCNIIMREQKLLHPYGQGIMGVVHAFNQNESNLHDYIQRITFMDDGHIMILCMFKLQAEHMSKFKYFMVDISYKRVFGEINELEFNAYDENNNSAFFEVYEYLTGEKPTFYYFNSENSEKKGWAAIIVDLDKGQAKGLSLALNSLYNSLSPEQHLLSVLKSCLIHFERNVRNSKYSDESKFLMRQLPKAKTKDEVDFLFDQLRLIDDENINDWITEYQTPWILASLNCNYSSMDYDVWMTTPFDTNVSEYSHANINREGTRLRLKTAIFHSWNYDLGLYRRFYNNYQYNVPMSSKNKSGVKRKIDANKRKEKQKTTLLLKSQNKWQKGNVKGVKNDEFQQQIQELEIEERKEELERKKLDNQLKKLEIARKEKELREGQ